MSISPVKTSRRPQRYCPPRTAGRSWASWHPEQHLGTSHTHCPPTAEGVRKVQDPDLLESQRRGGTLRRDTACPPPPPGDSSQGARCLPRALSWEQRCQQPQHNSAGGHCGEGRMLAQGATRPTPWSTPESVGRDKAVAQGQASIKLHWSRVFIKKRLPGATWPRLYDAFPGCSPCAGRASGGRPTAPGSGRQGTRMSWDGRRTRPRPLGVTRAVGPGLFRLSLGD